MEDFKDAHSIALLGQEWLTSKAQPAYFKKFHSSLEEGYCCIMITDTKSTWAEVLTINQFSRRFQRLNGACPKDDDTWRTAHLRLLTKVHTPSGIDGTLMVSLLPDTRDADLALEIEWPTWKWEWHATLLGPKTSAAIISAHLIMPLIAVVDTSLSTHTASDGRDAKGQFTTDGLGQAIDVIARRSHKQGRELVACTAFTKPRLVTALRRFTVVSSGSAATPDLEILQSFPDQDSDFPTLPENNKKNTNDAMAVDKSEDEGFERIQVQEPPHKPIPRSPLPPPRAAKSPSRSPPRATVRKSSSPAAAVMHSATESEPESDANDDASVKLAPGQKQGKARVPTPPPPGEESDDSDVAPAKKRAKLSSSAKPASKAKKVAVESSDDEEAAPAPTKPSGPVKKGPKQPVKRPKKF